MPVDAGEAARHQRHDPGRRQQADLEIAEAAAQSVARVKRDGDREHDEIVVENVGRREQAAGRQRRGLDLECGIALPQPGETGGQHQRQRDLHRIGQCERPRPTSAVAENIDWIFSQPVPPCSSTTVCVKFMESANACQTLPPSVAKLSGDQHRDRDDRRADRAPSPARQQRDRNQNAELRLVGEAADQQACKPGPAIEPMQRAAEQRRGEKSVLAMADVDENGREGGGQSAASPAAAGSRGSPRDRRQSSPPARPQGPRHRGSRRRRTATAKKNGG